MSIPEDLFHRSNEIYRRRAYQQWHRQQSKQQILRSQVGFKGHTSQRPKACEGCTNYHGLSYGTTRESRTQLICAIHPSGWLTDSPCPDWTPAPPK